MQFTKFENSQHVYVFTLPLILCSEPYSVLFSPFTSIKTEPPPEQCTMTSFAESAGDRRDGAEKNRWSSWLFARGREGSEIKGKGEPDSIRLQDDATSPRGVLRS